MKSFIWWLFGMEDSYWVGRLEGWRACEDLICKRIKEKYPEKYKEMWEELVQ